MVAGSGQRKTTAPPTPERGGGCSGVACNAVGLRDVGGAATGGNVPDRPALTNWAGR
ncbi:hypothetical protein [Rubrivirga litoralis]|uniref:Uncharacterized protein n=1 Tax=Rubrivirga litoralis TaxID=3075598 RepID=A0ABU3BPU6_9BACT|nr:hypothetical protein [Rubrivirga sp. F394]MDT0631309.1 hypothetical protein [Rubrivirga sp. F394]